MYKVAGWRHIVSVQSLSGRGLKCPEKRIVNSMNEHRSSCFSAYKDLPKT